MRVPRPGFAYLYLTQIKKRKKKFFKKIICRFGEGGIQVRELYRDNAMEGRDIKMSSSDKEKSYFKWVISVTD